MIKPITNHKLCTIAMLLIFISIQGCIFDERSDPANHTPPSEFDIVPLGGVTTKLVHSDTIDWAISDPQDSFFQEYRIPRSVAEFSAQIASGLWIKSIDHNGITVYAGRQFILNAGQNDSRCWKPFHGNTITYTQNNGFPDELAFAVKAPRIAEIDIEYKVNASSWYKLQPRRDFGILGTDSILFSPEIGSPVLESTYTLVGINLKTLGKTLILEGSNKVSVRVLQGKNTQATKTIDLNYSIVGIGVQESDSSGIPAKSEEMIFYKSGPWGNVEQKRTYIFISTRHELNNLDIRYQSVYGEKYEQSGVDSNLNRLPMLGANAREEDDGWRAHRIELGTILELRISKSQFVESTLPNTNERQVFIYGKIVLTPGFPPDDMPFKFKLPVNL